MILKACIVIIFIQNGVCNETDDSQKRVQARIHLLQTLKSVLEGVAPTKEERKATYTFIIFLNSSNGDDYIDAFYALKSVPDVRILLSFLNGIIFHGNPNSKEWKAAEVLEKMIKTKFPEEKLQDMVQGQANTNAKISPVIRSKRFSDYKKLFKYPKLLTDEMEDIYRRRCNNQYILYRNGLLFALPLHPTLKEFYTDLLNQNLYDDKWSNMLVVPNTYPKRKLLNKQTYKVNSKTE